MKPGSRPAYSYHFKTVNKSEPGVRGGGCVIKSLLILVLSMAALAAFGVIGGPVGAYDYKVDDPYVSTIVGFDPLIGYYILITALWLPLQRLFGNFDSTKGEQQDA
jgi:hypothetical protein